MSPTWSSALLAKLQQFLLELGKGFAFMGRQQRITLDGRHFFIDLVFYNRITRRSSSWTSRSGR